MLAAAGPQAPQDASDPVETAMAAAAGPHAQAPAVTADKGKFSLPQAALSAITGTAASVGAGYRGLWDLATGKGADKAASDVNDTEQRFTTKPNEATADAMASNKNPLTWVPKIAHAAGEKAQDLGASPGVATAVETGINAIPMAAGVRGIEGVPKTSGQLADEAALREGQKAGYVVPPATSNPTFANNLLEGAAGKLTTAQLASVKNQSITNGLVNKEFGLPQDAPVTHEAMEQIRSAQSPAYEAIKQVPDIAFGPTYDAELNKLGATSNKITSALPNFKSTGSQEVQALVDSLRPAGGKMDGETAVELSKVLRSESSNYQMAADRANDPQARTLARAYRGAGEAVENAIEDHLNNIGQPELAQNWDDARRTIAKTYSVQNALDGAGNVDATKLGKQLLKGKPLSGNLETAANFALAFPKAARNLKESAPGISPLDVYAGAALDAASGNHIGLAAGPGRMFTRSALLSKIGQKLAIPSAAIKKGTVGRSLASLTSKVVPPVAAEDQNNDE